MKHRLALATAFVLLALGAFYFWHRSHPQTRSPVHVSDGTYRDAVPEEYAYEPAPHISLRINGTHEPVVHAGTPLLISVRLANQRAINAQLLNRTRQLRLAALQEKLAQGKESNETVDALSARLQRDVPIKTVELGSETKGFADSIRFVRRMPNGQETALPWKLDGIGGETGKKLILEASTTAELDFGVSPADAAKLEPAEYVIVAILEVTSEENRAPAQWRGRVESEGVTLKILPEAGKLSAAEAVARELDFVSYFLATHQADMALIHAQKALAGNPTDIGANIAVGDAKAAQGDLAGALEALENALMLFHKQQANAYERPTLLSSKISDLQAKLGAH